MTSTFGYFDVRGVGQPIRLLLTFVGEKFIEKSYTFKGIQPNCDMSDWLKEKYSHNLDFPNLPYYFNDDVRLSQSGAILRYLARKYSLDGKCEEEWRRIDLLQGQLVDLRFKFTDICRSSQFEKDKVDYFKQLLFDVKELSTFLGERPYFAGDNLTYVDFIAYEYLYQQQAFKPEVLDGLENLQRFYRNFENLPQLSEYIKKTNASKMDINPRLRSLKIC
ncbi:Glutathione S-transferase, mu [Chamberlinius hualienensis]